MKEEIYELTPWKAITLESRCTSTEDQSCPSLRFETYADKKELLQNMDMNNYWSDVLKLASTNTSSFGQMQPDYVMQFIHEANQTNAQKSSQKIAMASILSEHTFPISPLFTLTPTVSAQAGGSKRGKTNHASQKSRRAPVK